MKQQSPQHKDVEAGTKFTDFHSAQGRVKNSPWKGRLPLVTHVIFIALEKKAPGAVPNLTPLLPALGKLQLPRSVEVPVPELTTFLASSTATTTQETVLHPGVFFHQKHSGICSLRLSGLCLLLSLPMALMNNN